MQRRHFLTGSLATAWTRLGATIPARSSHPALIPYPQKVQWTDAVFACSTYAVKAPAEAGFAAAELVGALDAAGAKQRTGAPKIVLRFADVSGAGKIGAGEAYELDVSAKRITITAPNPSGLLYGVATLRQLIFRGARGPAIAGCRITDWPAFAWRGFMHDVGRNYQQMTLLRRFIDVMARYKMNVFHFHLADGPGYRIECRVHPELNASSSYVATRHPGKYYTYAEINEFIAYCRQRNIMIVPEIDMPGHSEYFNRAFGFDMQDERGVKIVEDVLNEFMDHVDTPFLHLGSDEVDVRNPRFMDRMASLVRSRGRQVMAWRPGNPPSDKFVSQIWSYGPELDALPGIPIVDSRNNYINHVDPFQAPVRLLNMETTGQAEGSGIAWGGILCHWPDLNVSEVMNIYRQSPVFPSMLAAAENYWRGHMPHNPQYWAKLPEAGSSEHARYAEFEARMLSHRDKYFNDWPFPYLKQTDIPWRLIGPFDHKGDLAAQFSPEREIRSSYVLDGKTYRWTDVVGATIAVNHVQYDGWLPKTRRGTVYALTYVRAPRDMTVGFWIGFNGPSRSNRRQQPNPQQGEWSTVGSKVWVNDQAVAPPVWKQPGRVADLVETPLVDEDYFYRPPTLVALRAGWNKILIKAPKGDKTWNWQFTCVPVWVDGDRVREVKELRFSTNPGA
jgi:hexosaminidase